MLKTPTTAWWHNTSSTTLTHPSLSKNPSMTSGSCQWSFRFLVCRVHGLVTSTSAPSRNLLRSTNLKTLQVYCWNLLKKWTLLTAVCGPHLVLSIASHDLVRSMIPSQLTTRCQVIAPKPLGSLFTGLSSKTWQVHSLIQCNGLITSFAHFRLMTSHALGRLLSLNDLIL